MTAIKPDKPIPLFGAGKLKAAAEARAGEPEPQIVACRSCGANIVWATTENGKAAPFDAKPITVYVINAAGIAAPLKGRISHFATCPNRDQHRKT